MELSWRSSCVEAKQGKPTMKKNSRGWMAGFGHKVISRVSGEMLAQLSGSLQELASKVCPAIVQIEVIGFGPAEEGGGQQPATKPM